MCRQKFFWVVYWVVEQPLIVLYIKKIIYLVKLNYASCMKVKLHKWISFIYIVLQLQYILLSHLLQFSFVKPSQVFAVTRALQLAAETDARTTTRIRPQ